MIKHWPTMLLGIIVAAIFLIAVFSFQVKQTESAVVTTFGKAEEASYGPGLHFRWPYPIQEVFRFDHRVRCFSGTTASQGAETLTKDSKNVFVSVFMNYRISDARKFYEQLETIENGEEQLNDWMRGYTLETLGRYNFDQLINTNPQKMCLVKIQDDILKKLQQRATPYGIEVSRVGIDALNIPESISKKVFERMNQERKVVASNYLAEGKKKAEEIRIETDSQKRLILAEAEAKAKEIRAEGDAKAAEYYAVFKKNPELAAFLRKLDSLQKILKSKTTLILDTDSAPFDILKQSADKINSGAVRQK
ncbi:protease modulator HflC [Lentisphaerota bacterium ZTH]|nr:protease modulator HflC [Lentisphaerota bacterium]WET06587.1 protease modulator HflC [Lentisphaerota bacterium ZTH]